MKPSTRRCIVQGRGALRRELTACLRTGRALRCRGRATGTRQVLRLAEIMISERPAKQPIERFRAIGRAI